MLQLHETESPTTWMVVDLIDGSAKAFSTYARAYNYCCFSSRKFKCYDKKGLIMKL